MRTSGSARKCRVEVKIETRIENQILLPDYGYVNFMVAFGMDFAERIFIQKVIALLQVGRPSWTYRMSANPPGALA